MKKLKKLLLTLVFVLSLTAAAPVSLPGTVQTVSAAVKINYNSAVLIKGQTKRLKISGTAKSVKWSSSNHAVATVGKKGKVTAIQKGTAIISAKTGKRKFTCKITVQEPSISKKAASLTVGDTITLKLNGTNQKISWASSRNNIAAVNGDGKVIGKAAGSATITATVLNKKYTCEITVKGKTPVPTTAPSVSDVWLSATGVKYHRIPNCGRMNPSRARKVTLSEARALGYEPCEKCF